MTYTHKHNGGNGVFEDNMQTQIAIPCGDNTTQGSFIALLDALVSKGTGQFGPLEDDMAACDCTTAVEASAARPDADGDA